jgi:transposase-like protein
VSRPRSSTRPLVEGCAVLPVEQVLHFPQVQKLTREIWNTVSVDLSGQCEFCGQSWKLTVGVTKTRQGPRFICPKCARRVEKLYRPPEAGPTDLACRRCHNLAYRSQYRKGILGALEAAWGT